MALRPLSEAGPVGFDQRFRANDAPRGVVAQTIQTEIKKDISQLKIPAVVGAEVLPQIECVRAGFGCEK